MASAKIEGTPTAAGAFTFTVKATNAWGSDSKEYTITIGGDAPAITTATLPAGAVGVSYSQNIAVTGTEPITITKASGDLPPGLTLS